MNVVQLNVQIKLLAEISTKWGWVGFMSPPMSKALVLAKVHLMFEKISVEKIHKIYKSFFRDMLTWMFFIIL